MIVFCQLWKLEQQYDVRALIRCIEREKPPWSRGSCGAQETEEPMVTLGAVLTELKDLLRDDPTTLSALQTWIEEERQAIASQFELPALRVINPATEGTTLTVSEATWLYPLPPTYHKYLFQVRDTTPPDRPRVKIYATIDQIDAIDPAHTLTGRQVECVAVQEQTLAIYPMVNTVLALWYYKLPTALDQETSPIPELPDLGVHQVLIPRVMLRAFRAFPDLAHSERGHNVAALQWWTLRLAQGERELKLLLMKQNRRPRIHGGRQPLP